MGQILYERPREKIMRYGAPHLTMSELIQAVIGTGSSSASAAKLARHITQLIKGGAIAYSELLEVKGVGVAKACQIMAAVELGVRVHAHVLQGSSTEQRLQPYFLAAHASKPGTVFCVWFDGAGREIDTKRYARKSSEHYSLTVRQILTDALAISARSIGVFCVIPGNKPITTVHMSFTKEVIDATRILPLQVEAIYGVYDGADKVERWDDAV